VSTTVLYTLYALAAVGAAALFLVLPSGRRPEASAMRWGGFIIGVAALSGFGIYWMRWLGPDYEGRAFFVIFAMVAVLAAARVVTHPRPVYSAVYFVLVVLAVTGLCVLGAAEFLAAALVIVYGGAILVTYVFVIMLAQQQKETPYDTTAREPLAAVTLGFVLVAACTRVMGATDPIAAFEPPRDEIVVRQAAFDRGADRIAGDIEAAEKRARAANDPTIINSERGNVRDVGEGLMTEYILAVQVAGVLLLVAMIGAVAIARKRIEPEALTPEERALSRDTDEEIHRRGREAVPF
jgi:NADH-quinone oxidoreductase subunit J